jgi:hypothetical protein
MKTGFIYPSARSNNLIEEKKILTSEGFYRNKKQIEKSS